MCKLTYAIKQVWENNNSRILAGENVDVQGT